MLTACPGYAEYIYVSYICLKNTSGQESWFVPFAVPLLVQGSYDKYIYKICSVNIHSFSLLHFIWKQIDELTDDGLLLLHGIA